MAGKSKFQISRLLDEKIKIIANNVDEYEPEFSQLDEAFIIGFHTSNVTNFVGLTTDIELYNAGQQTVGLVFFKSTPSEEDVKKRLLLARESYSDFGPFATDKNDNLYLIYTFDPDSKLVVRKIFDLNEGSYLAEQPKLSVLDVEKLYNHSALVRVSLPLKLDILDKAQKCAKRDKLEASLSSLKKSLSKDSKKLKLHLIGSSYSTNSLTGGKNLTETLYDYLDAPQDVDQMGDYLPQLTKEDKKKLVDKWRNKVKAQRAPLEIKLEHEDHGSFTESTAAAADGYYKLNLVVFMYIHMTDPISKSMEAILNTLRNHLSLVCHSLSRQNDDDDDGDQSLTLADQDEPLKVCDFKPACLGHIVSAAYAIPQSKAARSYESLRALRRELHSAYLVALDRPQFRYSQRITNCSLKNADETNGLLCNVHREIIEKSGIKSGSRTVIEGVYTYHHYMQDRIGDSGWGCAYRSLQTIVSWFKHQGYIYSPDVESRVTKTDQTDCLRQILDQEARVPTHEEIQRCLVDIGDKQANFIKSEKWIGSQEVCYVLNHLFNLESKFISVSSGDELVYKARDLGQHFAVQSTPVMIGGGVLAHTIIGVDFNEKNGDTSYLILDPHYTGAEDPATITKKGWCGWKKNSFWDKNSFYNLCLPQRPVEF